MKTAPEETNEAYEALFYAILMGINESEEAYKRLNRSRVYDTTYDERELKSMVSMRSAGFSWEEIARRYKITPSLARKRTTAFFNKKKDALLEDLFGGANIPIS